MLGLIADTNTNHIINIFSMDSKILITILLTLAVTVIIYSVRNYFRPKEQNQNQNTDDTTTTATITATVNNEHKNKQVDANQQQLQRDNFQPNESVMSAPAPPQKDPVFNNQPSKPIAPILSNPVNIFGQSKPVMPQSEPNLFSDANRINVKGDNLFTPAFTHRSAPSTHSSSTSSNDFSSISTPWNLSGHSSDSFRPVLMNDQNASTRITVHTKSETSITFGNSEPITIKKNETKHIDIPVPYASDCIFYSPFVQGLKFAAACSDQGRREYMQNSTNMVDMGSTEFLKKMSFLLFDGHGTLGAEAAKLCTDHLHGIMAEAMQNTPSIEDALFDTFKLMDKKFAQFAQEKNCDAGAVGVYVYYESDEQTGDNFVYVANVGDCRAILCSNGKCKQLTVDHNTKNANERTRCGDCIRGGVLSDHVGVTRAIGDYVLSSEEDADGNKVRNKLKGLSWKPNIVKHRLSEADEFMIIACDGLWECGISEDSNVVNDVVMKHCRRSLRNHNDVDLAAKDLIKLAQQESMRKIHVDMEALTSDNISVMVVGLGKNKNIVPQLKDTLPRPKRRLFGRKLGNKMKSQSK